MGKKKKQFRDETAKTDEILLDRVRGKERPSQISVLCCSVAGLGQLFFTSTVEGSGGTDLWKLGSRFFPSSVFLRLIMNTSKPN